MTRKTGVKVYMQQDKWVEALDAAQFVEIVIFNQDINWLNKHCDPKEPRTWVRMYQAIKEKQAAFVHLEFLWQSPGTLKTDIKWTNRLENGKGTVQAYLKSLKERKVDALDVERDRRNTLPRLFLECYPAWILTEDERARTSGILW